MNPTDLLERDHRRVERLFRAFGAAGRRNVLEQETAFLQLKRELEVHATIEEKLFYPALRAVSPDDVKVEEALRDHRQVAGLLADLSRRDPGDSSFIRGLEELRSAVERHVAEEESRLFPLARKALPEDRLRDLGGKMDTLQRSLRGGPRFRRSG